MTCTRLFTTLIIVCGVGIGALWLVLPPATFNEDTVFSISSGEPLQKVALRLKDEGYIRSPFVFSNIILLLGRENRISPGEYYFKEKVPVFTIARRIAFSRYGITPIRVTVPEGRTVFEMAEEMEVLLPAFSKDEFIAQALPLEGYLFPETYFVFSGATAEEVIERMQATFNQKTRDLFSQMTEEEIREHVIMASLIEREAKGDDDRALIAGVLWKRLSIGMPLQVDATVLYAEAREGVDAVSAKESLYNTYTYKGLPPGPIANPGLLALRASLNPTETDYLYYIHDNRGTIHFARTFDEHRANIARYLRTQ